ncbi:MAG: hypothetical protein EHM64_11470 [Ignavibacteriae bacterium]|nr:MAG: hypothetical protein EHM64_11470 [Ignavibacteriota bacterium]
MTNNAHVEKKLHWKWVLLSVVAGLIIVGASYFIVAPTFHSGEVQVLMMLGGCIVTGAVIGYFSPGITINEASLGGALVMVIMFILRAVTNAEIHFTTSMTILLLILGIGFSWLGGWAGEKIQGDETSAEEKHTKKFLWKWVVVGAIIGFALNVLFVFILSTLFPPHIYKLSTTGFIVSFVIMGFVVGYKSPGITLSEPAVAGLFAVILDWIFLRFIITYRVPGKYIVIGLIMGFFVSLLGAWLGELYQQSRQREKVEV